MATATIGNIINANPTPGNSFYQFTHNQNAGSDGLIVIQLTMSNAQSYSGCTYGGQTMTQLYSISRGGLGQRMSFFYLENPPTGNNTLRINFTGSVWNPISIHSRSFTGSGGIGNNGNTGGQTTELLHRITQTDKLERVRFRLVLDRLRVLITCEQRRHLET